MIYIGIDPGKDGAMAFLWNHEETPEIWPFHAETYKSVFTRWKGDAMRCCMERAGAMPGQGVTSMFKFGENYGFIQGLLAAYSIPYETITPRKWKKEFQITADKNTSISVCRRLFPAVSLRRTRRCQKDHDGMAEALLLAEYARRHMG